MNWAAQLEKARAAQLPERVEHALTYLNWAACFNGLAMRLLALCTAVEALVHTDRHRSTRQFTRRLAALAADASVSGLSEDTAASIYDHRSAASHGMRPPTATDAMWDSHDLLEETLRRVLRKCLSDSQYCNVFASDASIRATWPIQP